MASSTETYTLQQGGDGDLLLATLSGVVTSIDSAKVDSPPTYGELIFIQ